MLNKITKSFLQNEKTSEGSNDAPKKILGAKRSLRFDSQEEMQSNQALQSVDSSNSYDGQKLMASLTFKK
jgi:hypothetical protein